MVERHYLKCKICGQLLIVREEKSNNKFPMTLYFFCGKCGSSFSAYADGEKVQFNGIDKTIEELYLSADEAHEINDSAYIFELSADYPVHKPKYVEHQNSISDMSLSPYMRMFPQLDDKDRLLLGNYIASNDFYYLYSDYDNPNRDKSFDNRRVELIKNIYPDTYKMIDDLYKSGFMPTTNLISPKESNLMNLLETEEVTCMFWDDQDIWKRFENLTNAFAKNLPSYDSEQWKSFKKFMINENNLHEYINRDNKIFEIVHKNRMKFLPAILLNAHKENDETVATFTIEELLEIYSSIYEMLMSNFSLVYFVENLIKRKDFKKFLNINISFKNNKILFKGKSFTKGQMAVNIKNELSKTDIGKVFDTEWINTSVRNGLAHRDYKQDLIGQNVDFSNGERYDIMSLVNLNLKIIKASLIMHDFIWLIRNALGD